MTRCCLAVFAEFSVNYIFIDFNRKIPLTRPQMRTLRYLSHHGHQQASKSFIEIVGAK